MKKDLVAPCGINCAVCVKYLENKCPGCIAGRKVNGRAINCKRRVCQTRTDRFCFSCVEFPCPSIKTLDKRYREKYGTSVIENLECIKDKGLEAFLNSEDSKWVNKEGTLCIHDKKRYKSG
jgi:hypothetical protein